MSYEKCIFKQGIRSAFIFLLSSFILLSAGASHREISIKWKVGDSPDGKMNLEWFQGDSIGFNLTSKMNREPFVFATNDVLVWEVRGWIGDHTNLYAVSTGTVVNAETGQSRYELTVEQTANLPEGTCLGYVKAMQLDGTNLSERVVLGWQWINVEWSETAQDYEITGALAKPYSTPAELAAIEAALSASLTAVSNRVDAVESDVSDLQNVDATFAALQPGSRLTQLEGQTNLIQSALQAEIDPAFTAWDKSTGISITESQISDLQSYLTSESDPAWHSGTGTIYSAIGTKQGAATAATDSELQAVSNIAASAVQADGSSFANYPSSFEATASGSAPIGDYVYGGQKNARGYWVSGYVTCEFTGTRWEFIYLMSNEYETVGPRTFYVNESTSANPPKTNWQVGAWGNPTPPTLSYNSQVDDFRDLLGAASTASVATVSSKVDDLESGTEDFETLNLNGDPITSFDDIGLTYTNAVRLNAEITITNNAAWDGYTITGSLTASNHAYLTVGETIVTPLATNGLASYEVVQSGSFAATVTPMTNGAHVTLPYYGTDAYLHIEMLPTVGIPGTVTAALVEKVTLNGVEDRDEAKLPKTVTRLDLIEHQPNPESATRRDYVEAEVLAAKDYANAQITAYSEDADKVVRCAMLRVGQDWVAEDVQGTGDRYLLVDADYSGEGEIRGNGRFYFSKNGHPLLSGGASAVYYGAGVTITSVVQSNGYDIATVTISTNAVTAEPFLECSEELVHAEWLNCTTLTSDWPTPTDGVYTLTITTESKAKLYFKAGELTGDASDVRIEGDKFVLGLKPIELIDQGNGLTYLLTLSNGVWTITQQ